MINSTCIIVDDEVDALYNVRKLLQRFFPEITILSECTNVDDAKKNIERLNPDFIFLDIRLGGRTGFELLEELNTSPLVIYTTAYDNYAIEAVSTNATDYLLKPINSIKFQKAVSSALSIIAERFSNTGADQEKQVISIPSKGKIKLIEIHKIVRCEARSNYTTYFLVNDESYLVAKTLKEAETELCGSNFLRIHQSHLVNLNYVDSYDMIESVLHLFDGTRLNVARSKRVVTKNALSKQNEL